MGYTNETRQEAMRVALRCKETGNITGHYLLHGKLSQSAIEQLL